MPDGKKSTVHAHAFPLALAREGEKVRVAALMGGKSVERRLVDLGLPVGSELEVIQRHDKGRMVVGRSYARVALGASTTNKILVVFPEDPAECGVCPRLAQE